MTNKRGLFLPLFIDQDLWRNRLHRRRLTLSSPGFITRIRCGETSLGSLPSAALTPVFGRGVAARGDFFTYARPWCHSGLTTQRCSYIIKDEWEIDRWIWRGCRLRWQCDWGHLYTDARRHLPFLPCELSPRCILAATSSCTERTSAPDNSDGALRLAQIHLICYTEDTKGLSREWSMMPPSRTHSECDSASSPLLFIYQ